MRNWAHFGNSIDRYISLGARYLKKAYFTFIDHVNIISSSDYLKTQGENRKLREENSDLIKRLDSTLKNLDEYSLALRGVATGGSEEKLAGALKRYGEAERLLIEERRRVGQSLGLIEHLKSSRRDLAFNILKQIAVSAGKAGYAAGIVDPHDRIVYVNKRLLRITGYTRKDLLRQDYAGYLVGEKGVIKKHFFTPDSQVEEVTVSGKREEIEMIVIKSPILDLYGKHNFHLWTYFVLFPTKPVEKPGDNSPDKIEEEAEELKKSADELISRLNNRIKT